MQIWILFFGLILSVSQAQNEDLLLFELQKQSEKIDFLKSRVIELEKEKNALAKKIKKMEDTHNIEGFTYLGTKRYSAGGKSHQIKEYKHNLTNIDFMLIPEGNFLMGSNNEGEKEKPVHQVHIKSFLISKYEITKTQWNQVMENSSSNFEEGRLPVNRVCWNTAKEFCSKIGLRLPSEAEWEYACRAGTSSKYYWGDGVDGEYMIYEDNSNNSIANVGSKKPNAFGLHDMSGNVHEWCEDWYTDYLETPRDGAAYNIKGKYRVVRGGSSGNGDCSSSYRNWDLPDNRTINNGFRVAKSLNLSEN